MNKEYKFYLFLVVSLLAALYIHKYSSLPYSYTWGRTLELFWIALRDENFIVMALYCSLAGMISNPTNINYRNSVCIKDFRTVNILVFTIITWVAVLLLSKTSSYNFLDLIALPFVIFIISLSPQARSLQKISVNVMSAAITLVIVSYIFTIFKSQLFVLRKPYDQFLISYEVAIFGQPLYQTVAKWSSSNPWAVIVSDKVYYLFFHHIALVAIFIYVRNVNTEQRRYITCLSLCYLIGASAYYIFPTKGPAFYDPWTFLYLNTYAEFTVEIQNLLYTSTAAANRGDLQLIQTYAFIAGMPSLHMAHETIMLFFSRRSLLMLVFSGLFWIASFVSVFVLGWHYFFDVLGGIILAVLVIGIVYWPRRNHGVSDVDRYG